MEIHGSYFSHSYYSHPWELEELREIRDVIIVTWGEAYHFSLCRSTIQICNLGYLTLGAPSAWEFYGNA